MLVEEVEYPVGLGCYSCYNRVATNYSEFVNSSSSGKLMAQVCDHMLTQDIQKSNASCSYDKCSMELDSSPVLASVEVCISWSYAAAAFPRP